MDDGARPGHERRRVRDRRELPRRLAAGPLAGKAKAATLLVEDAHSPAVSFSAGYRGKVDNAYVVGGVNAVSQATANAIADSLGLKHAQ